MLWHSVQTLCLVVFLAQPPAMADQLPLFPADELPPSQNEVKKSKVPVYEEYFTIDDSMKKPEQMEFWQPTYYFNELIDRAAETMAATHLNLMRWLHHKGTIGNVTTQYQRERDFGHGWIIDPNDKNRCLDTRQKVLIRDSAIPVSFRKDNPCSVEHGEWHDPYTGKTFNNPSDLDIDHVVPLKHAYDYAAWKWSNKKRCLYANYTANEFHLLPVENTVNRRKLNRSPDKFMPPNEEYSCEYLDIWLKIKLIWSMPLTPPESEYIRKASQDLGCGNFSISKKTLKKQRKLTVSMEEICN